MSEVRGEDLRAGRGPWQLSLEGCDLGQGPGVVRGACAAMPRSFAAADRVMDLQTRLVTDAQIAHLVALLLGRAFPVNQ